MSLPATLRNAKTVEYALRRSTPTGMFVLMPRCLRRQSVTSMVAGGQIRRRPARSRAIFLQCGPRPLRDLFVRRLHVRVDINVEGLLLRLS